MKRILVRADGGIGIGYGHLTRTMVLSNKLKKKGYAITYICNTLYKEGVAYLIKNGFDAIETENPLKTILCTSADGIITDSYEIDNEYIEAIYNQFKIVGYIDDNEKYDYKADFIINQNYKAETLLYKKCDVKRKFLGSHYLMLREEFSIKHNAPKDTSKKCILVTIGGSDRCDLTSKILSQVKTLPFEFEVVIGNAFPFEQKLIETFEGYNHIHLSKNPIMSELMQRADVAISACGSTLYELAVLGVPTLGIVVAENQAPLAERMHNDGLIHLIEEIEQLDNEKILKQKLLSLIKNIEVTPKNNEMQKQKFSMTGIQEVVEYITSKCNTIEIMG